MVDSTLLTRRPFLETTSIPLRSLSTFLLANRAIPQQPAHTRSLVSVIANSSMSSRPHSRIPFHGIFTSPRSHLCINRQLQTRTSGCTVNFIIQMLSSMSTSAFRTAHHPHPTIQDVNSRRSSLPSCSGPIRLILLISELRNSGRSIYFLENFPSTFAHGHPLVLVTTLRISLQYVFQVSRYVFADILQLPDSFESWISSWHPRWDTQRNQLMAHCRRELIQAVWRYILDDDFIHAMIYGVVVTCYDGIKRRIYPRLFTYSADYPEK